MDLGELGIEDSAVLRIGGTNTLPVFDSYELDTLSTVEYAGSTQSIATNVVYGNLSITTAGTKTPGAALNILNDFSLSNGSFTGGNFNHLVGGHWNMTSGTFTNTGTTIQLNGLDSQRIVSSGPFSTLTINKTSGPAYLGGNITVNNTLAFTAGKLWLMNGNLNIGNTATITGASATNYIIADSTGSLVQQVVSGSSKTYPVGTPLHYIPGVVTLTAGSVTDNISMRVMDEVLTNGETGSVITAGAVDATWLITEAAPGGTVANLTLQWPGALELPGFMRAASRLAHYTGGTWDYGTADMPATGSDPYILTRTGITSFSPFAISTFQALPVTWLNISGRNNGADNLISWSTANETGNEYFIVEVSPDGRIFSEAGRVPGANNSTTEQHYTFLHKNVPYTTAWYRIKQVDIDGRSSYSKIIQVIAGEQIRSGLVYITNPAQDRLSALIQAERSYPAHLYIVDAAGRIILKQSMRFNEGRNNIEMNISGSPQGIYFLHYADEYGKRQTVRFVKK